MAGGPGHIPGLLAGDDGWHDAAIEHADGVHDGTCQPTAETHAYDTSGVPGSMCPGLNSICAHHISGRHADPPAGEQLVLASSTPLAHRRGNLRTGGWLSVQSTQGTLPQAVPQPVQLLRALLSQRSRGSLAVGSAPRRLLPGLLLGADAGHVWTRNEQPGLDGCADRGNGGGEDVPRRPAPEPYHRICAATAGGFVAGSSRVAFAGWSIGAAMVQREGKNSQSFNFTSGILGGDMNEDQGVVKCHDLYLH
jgi:hypothetical protein